jgi:hypothetical protein
LKVQKHNSGGWPKALRGELVARVLARAWRSRDLSHPRASTSAAGAGAQDKPAATPTREELEEIAPLLLKSGAAGLAWRQIRNSDQRAFSAARQLHQAYRFNSIEAALHERRLKQVIPVLRNRGVEPLLVKGWAIARLYPEPGLRPYCDLDLCVSPDSYDAAAAALEGPGMQWCKVDLHSGFGKFYERQTDDIFARSRLVRLGDLDVRVLGAEDDLRFICLHVLRHGAARPLWLADVAVLLESLPDDFDWDVCLSGSRRHADWVACAIGLASRLLGACLDGVPVAARAKRLPKWFVPPVLKEWGTPCETPRQVAAYLRSPVLLSRELLHHWPNPIEATMTVEGPFNEVPRLLFQLSHVVSRAKALFLERSAVTTPSMARPPRSVPLTPAGSLLDSKQNSLDSTASLERDSV